MSSSKQSFSRSQSQKRIAQNFPARCFLNFYSESNIVLSELWGTKHVNRRVKKGSAPV